MDKFSRYSNHERRAAFTSVLFGHDEPLLEVELNELQQLQDEARRGIVRRAVPSGFTERVRAGFRGDPFVYTPQANGLILRNTMLIAPCTAMVNGHEVHVTGDFTYDKLPDYVRINLGNADEEGSKDSLVYLEVWFETVPGDQPVPADGYFDATDDASYVGTPALDDRVGAETSRRVALRWAVRVKPFCDFTSYPEGLGYTDVLHYSSVYAKAGGQLGTVPNVSTVFAPATAQVFRDEPFFGDQGLFVAGRPDYDPPSSTLFGRYVYALPMLRVRRRNASPWSLSNPNGAPSYNQMLVVNDSSVSGDLLGGMRPDHLAHDTIDPTDVTDLRRTVSFAGFNTEHLGDETVAKVISGQLATHGDLRTRRVQFGNPRYAAESLDTAKLVLPFENTLLPTKPVFDPTRPIINATAAEYVDSVDGSGLLLNGHREYSYSVRTGESDWLLRTESGTVDLFMQPLWHGGDPCSQVLLRIVNESGSPVFRLAKEGAVLVLSQFNYEESANNPAYGESRAEVDLTKELLMARRFYHVRVSWSSKPMPLNGQIFLYINGQLKSQAEFLPTRLVAHRLILGDSANPGDASVGVVVDSLVAYSKHFEVIASNSIYSFARNKFWPKIPADFINGDALLLPAFNGLVSHFSDNAAEQETIVVLRPDPDESLKTFRLVMNADKYVDRVIATLDGTGASVDGVWFDVGTNAAYFRPYEQTVTKVYVQCVLALSPGCGGQDMPVDIAAAALVKYTDEEDVVNYGYELSMTEEVSFCPVDAAEPRQVHLLRPRKVAGTEDRAYDFANASRERTQCWARLIYYNVSGNGTNKYDVPMHVYGYKVCGVVGCTSAKIVRVVRIPNEVLGEEDVKFTVYFATAQLIGTTLTLELATEGLSFDHDLNAKTLVANVTRCGVLSFVADGVQSRFTVPVDTAGGILRSVFTFLDYELDDEGWPTGNYTPVTQCFQDGQIFYDEHGLPTSRREFEATPVRVTDASFGTPFVTVVFTEDTKPRSGVTVQLPIVYSCQLPSTSMLSVWYTYMPYQGVLEAGTRTVTRVSGWTAFTTTLGTGKPGDAPIRRNVVNYLPGGMAYGYAVDNRDVVLRSTSEELTGPFTDGVLNTKFVLLHGGQLRSGEDLCTLATSMRVSKNAAFFQDGRLSIDNVDLDLFFDDGLVPCTKYTGAWCTVVDDATGELMVMVIGSLETSSTVVNHLRPTYGDVFRITGRPTLRW